MLMSALADAPARINFGSAGNVNNGVERAMAVESLLLRILEERRAGNAEAIVRTEDYNAVMLGWSNSGNSLAAALRVEDILSSMQELYTNGDTDVQPNRASFQIAIEAWTKADDPNAVS